MKPAPEAETLFEASWEVCNKVGGIHTVIRSKLQYMQRFYPNYILLGPINARDSHEFDEQDPPEKWKELFNTLAARGVQCAYGTWISPGQPTVILVGFDGLLQQKNDLKRQYWERFGIDSLRARWDFDEPLCWATAVGMLVEEYTKQFPGKTALHAHEWMAGFSLLYTRMHDVHVGTVFTTHATMLGRTMAGAGYPLFEMLSSLVPGEWAYKLNVEEKHSTEVACAREADVFTTVSEITGGEATVILGRKPDVLLLNGFHTDRFPTFEETSLRHAESKELLKEATAYLFFPNYQFDLEKTSFFYTSGRYEFGNKGMDITVESLARLNRKLKEENSDKTVVMFFWVMDLGHGKLLRNVLERKNYYSHIKNYVEWHSKPLIQKIVLDFLSGYAPGKDDQFTSEMLRDIRATVRPARQHGNPPLTTHEISEADPLLQACYAHGLLNREEDRVKVLIYPGMLDGTDGLLNLLYYDAIVGTHLGIFASQYEPWGYTPLESAVVGVPAITTDLAGFGKYVQTCYHGEHHGIEVLPRLGVPREQVVQHMAEYLYEFLNLSKQERVQEGFAAKILADTCSWEFFGQQYIEAHNKAVERKP